MLAYGLPGAFPKKPPKPPRLAVPGFSPLIVVESFVTDEDAPLNTKLTAAAVPVTTAGPFTYAEPAYMPQKPPGMVTWVPSQPLSAKRGPFEAGRPRMVATVNTE